MSDLSKLLTVAHLSWATWAIRSWSLICLEQPEQFAHNRSFVLSDLSELLRSLMTNDSARGMSCTSTPYTYASWKRNIETLNRKAKQERGITGEREKNVVEERGNAEHKGKIEECGHAARVRKGLQERVPNSVQTWKTLICLLFLELGAGNCREKS